MIKLGHFDAKEEHPGEHPCLRVTTSDLTHCASSYFFLSTLKTFRDVEKFYQPCDLLSSASLIAGSVLQLTVHT